MHSVLTERYGEKVKLRQITGKKGLSSLTGSSARMGAAILQELVGEIDQKHHWARFGL